MPIVVVKAEIAHHAHRLDLLQHIDIGIRACSIGNLEPSLVDLLDGSGSDVIIQLALGTSERDGALEILSWGQLDCTLWSTEK